MSTRTRYIAERVLLAIPTLLAMTVFVFLLIRLVPGDPVQTMLGFRATPQNVATIRHQLHLDEPLLTQYIDWMKGLLHGDLGRDYVSHAPLSELLGNALPVTLELTFLSMGLALAVGVPMGVMAAARPGTARRLTDSYVILGVSIPDFWLGTLLVLLFAATLVWLPPSGYTPFSADPVGNLRYMALPVLTLSLIHI